MGILGSIGSAIGSVASGVSTAAGGIEGGATLGVAGAASVSGLARFDTGPSFAGGISAASFIEGPMPVSPLGSFEPIGASLGGLEPMGIKSLGTIDLIGGTRQPFNPMGEILFKAPVSEPAVIQQAKGVAAAAWDEGKLPTPVQAVSQAESILSQTRLKPVQEVVAEPEIIKEAAYWFTDVPGSKVIRPAEVIMPKIEPMIVPMVAPLQVPNIVEFPRPQIVISPASEPATKTENMVSARPAVAPAQAPAVLPQPTPEGVEEMVIEEKILDQQEDKTEIEESEDVSESKIKIVEAEHVSNERRKKIRRAVRTAKEKGITVAEALPIEYWSDKSPLVGEGTDWTLGLTAQALQINPKEYMSLEEAEEVSIASVAENIPVAEGIGGRRATIDEVRKVTKGEKHVLGSKTPAEIVLRRLIKRKVEVAEAGGVQKVLEDKVETTSEPTLKDFPQLAEVFKKAA